MQFFPAGIFTCGLFWIRRREKFAHRFCENRPSVSTYAWIVLVFSLFTIGLSVFSDQFATFCRR